MKKTLIQANNLDTVIDVFTYIYLHPDCTKQDIADYIGFTLRQVDYYFGACMYLGLLNEDFTPTSLAIDIFTNNRAEIPERVYEAIISDDLIGKIFARRFVLPDEEIEEYATKLVMEQYPGYSDAVYERRTSNIIKWCDRIIKYMKKKSL